MSLVVSNRRIEKGKLFAIDLAEDLVKSRVGVEWVCADKSVL
jgi:hypothetical protein